MYGNAYAIEWHSLRIFFIWFANADEISQRPTLLSIDDKSEIMASMFSQGNNFHDFVVFLGVNYFLPVRFMFMQILQWRDSCITTIKNKLFQLINLSRLMFSIIYEDSTKNLQWFLEMLMKKEYEFFYCSSWANTFLHTFIIQLCL